LLILAKNDLLLQMPNMPCKPQGSRGNLEAFLSTELDNHLGVSDKTLAEFIIDLAKRHPTLPAFRVALEENGAEFPVLDWASERESE
jgi:hypothetical protein